MDVVPGKTGMSAPSHPSFSDFSHVASKAGLHNTRFAVSLREDPENLDKVISKILPMAMVVPGVKKERVIRKVQENESTCMKPECVARRETFNNMSSENEALIKSLQEAEGKLAASKNKLALTEKSVDMADAKNEILLTQIEEAQSKIMNIKSVVEKGESRNQVLRDQMKGVQDEIQDLKNQVTLYKEQVAQALASEHGPQVQFNPHPGYCSDIGSAMDVSMLLEEDSSEDEGQEIEHNTNYFE
jgi:predicted nuclease with TOPRIM domain